MHHCPTCILEYRRNNRYNHEISNTQFLNNFIEKFFRYAHERWLLKLNLLQKTITY